MEITENRLKHILAVANKMEAAVRKNPQAYTISPEDAFVLYSCVILSIIMFNFIGYKIFTKSEIK